MNIKDVENLAELAKIELAQEEKESIISDLESILNYVKQIEEVKTPDTDVSYEHRNIWREDQILEKTFSKEQITSQYGDKKDDFVKVKKIL